MKLIDVPVFNDDGSVQFTQVLNEKEVQVLLQFALNFLVATGINVHTFVQGAQEADDDEEPAFGDTRNHSRLPS